MGESVASVTTGTDDLWDELVLDSGSVSTACPYAWCSDISVNDGDKGVPARHSAPQNTIAWIKSVECQMLISVGSIWRGGHGEDR